MANIACVGHTTLDIIFLLSESQVYHVDLPSHQLCMPFPSKCWVEKRVTTLGGNAPNSASGLEKLGHKITLISKLGDDEWGGIIRSHLHKHDFDLTYTSTEGESDTSVILSYAGDRTILAYHATEQYPFPKSMTGVEWIYLSSLGFKSFEGFHADMLSWLSTHPEVQVVYNPGRAEIAQGYESISNLCSQLHTLILNKEEAAKILGKTVVESTDVAGIKQFLQEFIDRGVARVVITDSKEGAYFSEKTEHYFHVNAFPGDPVDTTGAGDSFSSGYMGGIAHGHSPLESLSLAAAQSASVVTQPGATNGLLTLEELDERLGEYPEIKPVAI